MTGYQSINPSSEELIAEHPLHTAKELQEIITSLWSGYQSWRTTPLNKRLVPVERLKTLIEAQKTEIAKNISLEMGKTFKDGLAEVGRMQLFCDHAMERATEVLAPRKIENPMASARLQFDPLGIVFSITPWNVPVATPFRSALPAIIAGNAVLLKPAPNVTICARIMEKLLLEAGFPENIFRLALLPNDLAEKVISDHRIRKISFVGSSAVGAHLASLAGEAVKPILLELGGSDPLIVLNDAEVERAATDAAKARCANAGQVCCSSKRIIVCAGIYQQFREQFISSMRSKVSGDPLEDSSDLGPLARKDILERLVEQTARARAAGSRAILEGGRKEGKGYFYLPEIFEEDPDLKFSASEEFFGPVATLIQAQNSEHAVAIANSSPYGLGGAVYTRSPEQASRIATDLESGFVHINRIPGLHPYIPFGGVKLSGFGRDSGDEGYLEYVNKKAVVG